MAIMPPVDAVELSRERLVINVRMKRMRELRLRHWLAGKIFAIGAWVAATGLEIELDE